jgi:hypothetical protein
MKNTRIARRAGLAGLLLALSVTVLGAGPSAAAESYSTTGVKYVSAWTVDQIQPVFTLQDLAAARIARVGITPIPIP